MNPNGLPSGFSLPLQLAAVCPDCDVVFNIKDGTCPRCGSEHGWTSLGRMWDEQARKSLTRGQVTFYDLERVG